MTVPRSLLPASTTPGAAAPGAAQVAPLVVAGAQVKSGFTRYMRMFPSRSLYLLDQLTAQEFVATYRLTMAYVMADGQLAGDDKSMAHVTKLTVRAWAGLRDKLVQMGMGRVEHGFWVDDDQLVNLECQRAASLRGFLGAQKAAENRRARDAA